VSFDPKIVTRGVFYLLRCFLPEFDPVPMMACYYAPVEAVTGINRIIYLLRYFGYRQQEPPHRLHSPVGVGGGSTCVPYWRGFGSGIGCSPAEPIERL